MTSTTQMLWRQVQARVQPHRGEHAEAEALAREAVAIIEQTDALNLQGAALWTSPRSSPPPVASTRPRSLEQALERYERKKNLAMAASVGPKLEACAASSV